MALNTIKPNAYLSTYIFGGAAAVAAAAQQRRHHQPDMQSYIAVGMRVPPIQAYALLTGSAWQCWWDTLHMTSSGSGGGGGDGGSSAAAVRRRWRQRTLPATRLPLPWRALN